MATVAKLGASHFRNYIYDLCVFVRTVEPYVARTGKLYIRPHIKLQGHYVRSREGISAHLISAVMSKFKRAGTAVWPFPGIQFRSQQ